jgi:hypothetical protein
MELHHPVAGVHPHGAMRREASLRATTVIRIDIESMKGKQHGFGEPEGDA